MELIAEGPAGKSKTQAMEVTQWQKFLLLIQHDPAPRCIIMIMSAPRGIISRTITEKPGPVDIRSVIIASN